LSRDVELLGQVLDADEIARHQVHEPRPLLGMSKARQVRARAGPEGLPTDGIAAPPARRPAGIAPVAHDIFTAAARAPAVRLDEARPLREDRFRDPPVGLLGEQAAQRDLVVQRELECLLPDLVERR
jgi:hypothetical protein